ncbi:DUF4328 domain-containing protein [Amycolatopsis sp.]|uniref:DUF4328 domain-containing protein n=1 Tax=Amycolatopsis sp. TaxID=37632 RepID=UPI002BA11AF5|nr:DUF4328 domain-containing protein [Amycolatopsis sp.]HVV13521.1 DUF4328 domain-containing protein [Amycolatopsis sp.]
MHPGRYHVRPRVRWVASPPPGATVPRRARPAERYTGPPAYPAPPRWGFPNLTWREPTAVPGTPSSYPRPMERVRALSRNAITILWFLAGLATVGAVAEFWRYALLVISRNSALDTDVVAFSDALEIIAALLTVVFGVLAFGSVLWWLYVARQAAGEESGQEPPRSGWQILAGTLIPLLNLVMAGSILAELEHAALRRPATKRPKPSRLVLVWWATWVLNGVLLILVIVWRFRGGIQSQADGVLLSALLDLSAAGLAALTAVVVERITSLLAPIPLNRLRPRLVVAVKGAPRATERPPRPVGASR